MSKLNKDWLEILSELFVNLSAAWFVIIFIEPQFVSKSTKEMLFFLTSRFLLGMVTLLLVKGLREKSKL